MNIFGPYFTEKEFKFQKTTPKQHKENMYMLVKMALNAIRKKYGPVKITSGWRSLEYNDHLRARGYNPSSTSQHLTGEAVDLLCTNLSSNREVFEWLRGWWPGQLFYYAKKGHVHIALPTIALQSKGRLYAKVLEEDS